MNQSPVSRTEKPKETLTESKVRGVFLSFFLSCAKNAQGAACQMWGRPKEESQNDAQNVFFLNGKRQIVYQTPGGRILS